MKDTFAYHKAVTKLREFFQYEKGFIEVPAQSRLSILAACEDPKTIVKYKPDGKTSNPMIQTGQMWLEHELLKNPKEKGFYCISTSYRNEPNPIEGRHALSGVFPLFEFESHGNMDDLQALEEELLEHLGFKMTISISYDEACAIYATDSIEAEHEEKMAKSIGNNIALKYFPQRSQPFWNMKQNGEDKNLYNKIDIILFGQETIGSAERSCNPKEMRDNFYNISDGEYAQLLYDQFGEQRVIDELDEYLLSYDFFPRYGGGIGMTRMARAMKLEGLI